MEDGSGFETANRNVDESRKSEGRKERGDEAHRDRSRKYRETRVDIYATIYLLRFYRFYFVQRAKLRNIPGKDSREVERIWRLRRKDVLQKF